MYMYDLAQLFMHWCCLVLRELRRNALRASELRLRGRIKP